MYGGKNGNFLEGCWELRIQQFNWLATLPPERKTFLEKHKGGTGTSATRRSFSRPFVRCVCWSTKGSVRGIKCVAGAGVIVVESKQAREARLLEAQAESLLRICDLRHGRFNKPNALRINTRRHLLNRSSPKPTRRTRTAQRPDPWCHHPHHQVVDFPEDRLAINHFVCQSRKTSLPFNYNHQDLHAGGVALHPAVRT
jgi:hypothetical protein